MRYLKTNIHSFKGQFSCSHNGLSMVMLKDNIISRITLVGKKMNTE